LYFNSDSEPEEYEDPQPQEPKEDSELKKPSHGSVMASSKGMIISDELKDQSNEVIPIEQSVPSEYHKIQGSLNYV